MFSKEELELFHKIVPDKKFLNSKMGREAALKGYRDALKDEERCE